MLERNGFEVQERLAATGVHLPVIVITGHDGPESRTRASVMAREAYFRKPVDGQALLDAIAVEVSRQSGENAG